MYETPSVQMVGGDNGESLMRPAWIAWRSVGVAATIATAVIIGGFFYAAVIWKDDSHI